MIQIRPVQPTDRAAWQLLWQGYNAFYRRADEAPLAAEVTDTTWARLLDTSEPMHALVAQRDDGELLGLVHYLFHRSTTRIEPVSYLEDLFTAPEARGQGVGRALIQAVYNAARESGAKRVYWHTQHSNSAARALYDKLATYAGSLRYTHNVA